VSARAGIVVTGTEVLTGRVTDRNGPWLAERLRERGVDLAHIAVVGDRPADIAAALGFFAHAGVDLVVTSGGLGPTADDLTAEVVGAFCGREMVLDAELEQRIAEILRPLAARFPDLDMEAVRESNRKQAVIPEGSTVLGPVGTAPGLVVPPAPGRDGPTVVVLPGPPRELHPLWHDAAATAAVAAAVANATEYRQQMLRLFGIPESEIAATLRAAAEEGVELDRLEITTCLRRAEVEVVTRFEPSAQGVYDRLAALVRERHGPVLFSEDGSTVDDQVASMLTERELTIGVAESCTGGLLAARMTERPGSSRYLVGGLVVYANEAKTQLAGVEPELIERHGAVSGEVAQALAAGARRRLGADIGVAVTGIAGPDGGTEDKPVGLVWLCAQGPEGALTRRVQLPGSRQDVRDRSTTVAMHLLRRLLLGEHDEEGSAGAPHSAAARGEG